MIESSRSNRILLVHNSQRAARLITARLCAVAEATPEDHAIHWKAKALARSVAQLEASLDDLGRALRRE